jgi:hypothetical protein
VVATVFSDSNKKYLSTDLLRDEPAKPGHLSPHVQLLGFRAINRVCDFCFDPERPEITPPGFYSIDPLRLAGALPRGAGVA